MYLEAIKRGGQAVITGSAGGLGKAAALRFLEAGLDIILVDLPGDTLGATEEELQDLAANGRSVTALPADVSDAKAMLELADEVFARGEVAVLMNNAGIGKRTGSWSDAENWHKVMHVNFFGVMNGVHAFLPGMIEAIRPAMVANTGSKQGITTPPGNPAYNVSKAAVKVLTEMLAYDLREAKVPISAHLFVPGFTYTPMIKKFVAEKPDGAWTSEQAIDYFLERVTDGDFYILCPDNDVSSERDQKRVEWALGDILENRPALSRWHKDFEDAFARHEKGI